VWCRVSIHRKVNDISPCDHAYLFYIKIMNLSLVSNNLTDVLI